MPKGKVDIGELPLTLTATPFELTPQQQQVHQALLLKAPPCAKMFFGALKAWSDKENPDRLSQSAHSVREIMKNIGPYLNVPVPDSELLKGEGKLGEKFDVVARLLAKAELNSENWSNNGWSGQIHRTTEMVLLELQECVKWRGLNARLRMTRVTAILKQFDRLHSALPEAIQRLHEQEWKRTYEFFIAATHHGRTTTEEFEKWLFHFEQMLLLRLATSAKKSLAEMDEIIKAGEAK